MKIVIRIILTVMYGLIFNIVYALIFKRGYRLIFKRGYRLILKRDHAFRQCKFGHIVILKMKLLQYDVLHRLVGY